MRYILLFTSLLLSGLLNGQNSTENFPKQQIKVKKLPARQNVWVFILAGQSNMAGRGVVEPMDTLPDKRIITISKEQEWILAKEPLHFYEPKLAGLDCGLSFGREMIGELPDSVTIALIPCAVGGSSIHQWLGDSLYRNVQLLSNFKEKVGFAKSYGTIKGILWHQGENDALTDRIAVHEQKLKKLIATFRSIVGNNQLPFLMGELGSFRGAPVQSRYDSINHILHSVAESDENSFVIETDDLKSKADHVHFNAAGQRSMGWRFARRFTGYYVNGRHTYKSVTTSKICTIHKELIIPSPNPQTATTDRVQYIGQGLKQRELRANISSSDWTNTHRERFSGDNGRTWSPWQVVFKEAPELNGFVQSGGPSQSGNGPLDPASGMLIKPVFQRILQGDPEEALKVLWSGDRRFSDHGFYQLSADNGKSWDQGHLLKYEEGPDFDPDNWGNPEYFRTNEMYIGGLSIHSGGNVVIAATIPVPYRDKEDEKVKVVFPSTYREGCVAGAMSFVGKWDPKQKAYNWQTSNRIFLPRKVSTRGLVEIDISELRDGRLLLIMRGSNVGLDSLECPGRKWISISDDGGLTWSDITDLRYDTGEQFYSPATMARTLRSTATGKLYCFLNISNTPPVGNGPRYPLQVAEIDEENVSIKKETVTIIDDLIPGLDSTNLQLSNFGLLEDRENNQVELTLTRIGERGGGDNIWDADTYRYIIRFKDEQE
ncbi:MAG: sialate O-acetylesterase [Bacteroidota bacterium]